MGMVRAFFENVKHAIRGERPCHRSDCSQYAREPHRFYGHNFCSRRCAQIWIFMDAEQRAREAGA